MDARNLRHGRGDWGREMEEATEVSAGGESKSVLKKKCVMGG